jgi:hypothetical protein
MSSKARFCAIILCILCLPLLSQAQTDDMIAYSNGDLFTWSLANNVPQQITSWGYNGGAVLSPDSSKIAFLSFDGSYADRIANSDWAEPFANIWVMDTATREFQWINDQSTATGDGIYRSIPVWSPDGTRLAWTELSTYPDTSIQIYDFRTNTITILANNINIGYQDGGEIYLPTLQWGGAGISRTVFNIVGDDFQGVETLEIYDTDTGGVFSIDLEFINPNGNASTSHHWLNQDGNPMIALQADNRWGLLDPTTGSYTPLSGSPVLQKVGDSSLQLIPVYNGSYSFDWYVNHNGTASALGYNTYSIESGFQPTIAPTGGIVAWNERTGVFIWDTGAQRKQQIITSDEYYSYYTPGPANIAWSPMEWVISTAPIIINVRPPEAPTPIPPTAAPVPTAVPNVTNACKLPARLKPGQGAVLGDGANNNVRQSWSANSAWFGEIYPAEWVYVHEGPVCNEGYNWYLVSNDYIYGWTAEGFNGVYWLYPA